MLAEEQRIYQSFAFINCKIVLSIFGEKLMYNNKKMVDAIDNNNGIYAKRCNYKRQCPCCTCLFLYR